MEPEIERTLVEWTERMRADEPEAVAIVLTGSYAGQRAGPYSDVDMQVVTRTEPRVPYRTILEEREGGRLVHISVGAHSRAVWEARRREPAGWSFCLPAHERMRLLWVAPGLGWDPTGRDPQPASPAELEDFVEYACKVKNAHAARDELALRLAAQDMARLCPSLLVPLNQPDPVTHRSEALAAALALPIAPPHYRDDMLACLGLTGQAISPDTLYERAMRLALGVVELLQAHPAGPSVDVSPDLPRYVGDGSLARYLSQAVAG